MFHCSILFLLIFVQHAVAFAQQGVPALRVTARNGASSLLIGSLHIAADGLRQPADSVMNGAKTYVIEGIPEPGVKSKLMERADEVVLGLSERADWAQALDDEQVEQLVRHVRCNFSADAATAQQVVARFLTFRSAAMAADLATYRCASPGLFSRDELLKRAAVARGLSPVPLESQAQANKQRTSVPEPIYQAFLHRAFTPESREALQRTVSALNTGDYAEITQAMRDLAPSPADADLYLKLMVADRNRAWMPALTQHLDAGNAVVNVGAAHLPGPDGLITLLRQRGYQVQPIVLPDIAAR